MAMPVRFGTDGIRGRFGEEITVDLAYRLGRAVALVFDAPVFVGYDTRESSPPLAAAVLSGLADGGAIGVNLGCFTTPGVAIVARQRGGLGVVVSASHNPYFDNGLKVLGVGGAKLDVATERELESALDHSDAVAPSDLVEPAIDQTAERDYLAHLRGVVPGDLTSLRLVVDCANGAASRVARELYASTGATLTMMNDQPNGRNINDHCGSTDVAGLVEAVVEFGADLGLAFDGDADRLIAVDARGTVRDGDDLIVLFAIDLTLRRALGGGLAVTSMSNLGVHRALASLQIETAETDVGDRNVLVALEERSWLFGGEKSGHLIFRDLAPTGDGLLTGLLLCDLVARRGPLYEQATAAWQRVPQELVSVARDAYDDAAVREYFRELIDAFGIDPADVRLIIRPSGTEPVVRVMVEALNERFVREFSARVRAHFAE